MECPSSDMAFVVHQSSANTLVFGKAGSTRFEKSLTIVTPNPCRVSTQVVDTRSRRRCSIPISSASDKKEAATSSVDRSEVGGLMSSDDDSGRVCGFAALLGPSNSGKSTLLNRVVGTKIAIVSPKVQTTRCRIAGIVTEDKAMTVYLDTPGIFHGNDRLDRAMVRNAWSSANSADVVAIIADAPQMFYRQSSPEADQSGLSVSKALTEILSRVPKGRKKYCVCLNKIDRISENKRTVFLERVSDLLQTMELHETCTLFPMSALNGEGVDEFTRWIRHQLPAGPWLYSEDDLTDMPMRSIAAEVTREKAFLLLKHELPYEIAVNTTSYKEQSDGSIRITQDLLVKRNSQKRIVTGQGGSMVKAIGMTARKEMEEMTGSTVHLMLTVKVRGRWKEEAGSYIPWGLDYNS